MLNKKVEHLNLKKKNKTAPTNFGSWIISFGGQRKISNV